MTTTPSVTLVRQKYQYAGGAERFVENALHSLAQHNVSTAIAARSWPADASGQFIPCNPFYLGRWWRDWSFHRCVCRKLHNLPTQLIQSHERIPCCDIYRAGDGVHREWLNQKARAAGKLSNLFQALSGYHRYILAAEQAMFEGSKLRAVICNSNMVRDEINHYFAIDPNKIHVIYNGVDGDQFHPSLADQHRARVRQQWDIPQQATVYLYVGSGFARKGVAPLIRAFRQLPESCYLLIVGKEKRLRHYQHLAARLALTNRIRFTDAQPDVAAFYGAADVFVLPTLYDPFPNVTLEAMSAGLPIITGIKSGTTDVLDNQTNGFYCDPLDIDALAQKMRLLLNADARAVIGRQARATVAPFSYSAMSQQLINLYTTLLGIPTPD